MALSTHEVHTFELKLIPSLTYVLYYWVKLCISVVLLFGPCYLQNK